MAVKIGDSTNATVTRSTLEGPPINPAFEKALDELVSIARQGHRPDSEMFNPSDGWLVGHMRVFQDLPQPEQGEVLKQLAQVIKEGEEANVQGKAALKAGPDVVFRLDSGGLGFFSQLGVVRRPDLTQYFIDGFLRNRDGIAFSEESQELFGEVFPYISGRLKEAFASGTTVVQSDRQICDAPGRSFHARQLLYGTHYLQLPYMWRQLTFDLPASRMGREPDILEVTLPEWLDELGMPEDLKARLKKAGFTKLIFKAPTKGLSLHLGFDYIGEHKMGPLTIAMFKVKQNNGLAVQAALSMARVKTLGGEMTNTAIVTAGPSLHGKSTLTIMIEMEGSELAHRLGLTPDPEEGVYPMNDDIVLLQPLSDPVETTREGHRLRISHGIDGTENNFYAMPFGLNESDDPITWDVVRGTRDAPNAQETVENVPVNPKNFRPDYMENPTRNMRTILSRLRLLERKGAWHILEAITGGRMRDSVHVPMQHTDRVFWQAVMRQNTVVPPLRRLSLEQYVRVLMYGEAVQMGAAAGAIGRPYVEYFSDPFIIGLEDDNANLMYYILHQMERCGQRQEYYVFNTGGVGAESNEQASGPRYKKIPRELTLMLQEAVLREAVKFEFDSALGSEIAVAIMNQKGEEVIDLRREWLPGNIYGEDEYRRRILELRHRRYYGRDASDKAGILRYTKVTDALIDPTDIPVPHDEREMAWMLSFFWHVDAPYNTLPEVAKHCHEGQRPMAHLLREIRKKYQAAVGQGLTLSQDSHDALEALAAG
ncbi:MAG: hypothetical protein L0177_05430 [Chloroflexi bacterium]|nr:hypothetical protein [Chloroflexota bacterium]